MSTISDVVSGIKYSLNRHNERLRRHSGMFSFNYRADRSLMPFPLKCTTTFLHFVAMYDNLPCSYLILPIPVDMGREISSSSVVGT